MSRFSLRVRAEGSRARRTNAARTSIVLLLLAGSALPALAARRQGPIVFTSQSDLWVMQADGSNPVNLTNDKAEDDFAQFSPDGRKIVWTKGGRGPTGELWVMNADGSDKRQLTFDSFSDFNASWSPDGAQIAWRSLRDGNRDIFVMNADGTNVRRLTTDPASDFATDWSPDGVHIAFTSVRSGDDAVWVMNADGSDQHQLTPNGMHAGIAGWSPDGTKLVFADGLCAVCGESDLFIMNADGTGITQLTDAPDNELSKSWSGDGRSVVGDLARLTPSENHLGKGDVAVWDVATGAVTKLTDTNGIEEGNPDWSQSGRPAVTEQSAVVDGLEPVTATAWSRADGVTNISYSLPGAGHVRVRVFDVAGREVARPVDEWQPAGSHVTSFALGAAARRHVFVSRVERGGVAGW